MGGVEGGVEWGEWDGDGGVEVGYSTVNTMDSAGGGC